jgi:hypothetical protein
MFRFGGADVVVHWHNGGHELGQDEREAAKSWIVNGSASPLMREPYSPCLVRKGRREEFIRSPSR